MRPTQYDPAPASVQSGLVTLTFHLLTLELSTECQPWNGQPFCQLWCFCDFSLSSYGQACIRLTTWPYYLDLWRHCACRWCGSLHYIRLPCFNFVSLPVPKIWLTFSQGVKRPVDLDLDLSASKSGHGSPLSCASFLSIFSLLRPSVLDLGSGQTDRQTDRWRPSTLNVPSYVAGHFVVLLSLFRI